MSGEPKISVVTISFNQAEFLEATILSVLGQDYPNVEYIICDPGSTDGSREIIEKYRDRFDKIILEPDQGPGDGLNKGLSAATGKYFYYLNSDDLVAPGAFREAVRILEDDDGIDVVYANGMFIDADGRPIGPVYSSQFITPYLLSRGLSVIVQPASFMRMNAVKAVGGFNPENRACWDGELFFDIAKNGGRFRRVWKNWTSFRLYKTSISGSGNALEKNRIEHRRMAGTLGGISPLLDCVPHIVRRSVIKALDYKRWGSYLKGPIRPHEIAEGLD